MFEIVQEYFAENFELTPDTLQPDTALADIGMDSMALMMAITDLEERMGIEVSDRDLEHIVTLGDIAALGERA